MNDNRDAIGSALGLAADIGEKSVEYAARYGRFVWRAGKLSATIVVAAFALAMIGSANDIAWMSGAAVLIAGGVTIFWLVVALPVVSLLGSAAQFEPIARVLRWSQVIGGWAFFVALALFYSAPGTDLGKLFLASVLGGLATVMLFGWRGSRMLLGIKMLIVAGAAASTIYLPKTSSAVSGLGTAFDRAASGLIAPAADDILLTEAALQATEFFDFEGDPLMWCRRDASRAAGYRCYDSNRRDPSTGEELTPISPEIIEDISLRLAAARAETDRQAAEASRQAAEAERVRQQQIAQERAEADRIQREQVAAEQEAFRRRYLAAGPLQPWDAMVSLNGAYDGQLSSAMRNEIVAASGGGSAISALLAPVVADGLLGRLFNGDRDLILQLNLPQRLQRMAIGRATVEFSENTALSNVVNARMALDVRMLETATGGIIAEFSVDALAPGRSNSEALTAARERLGSSLQQHIASTLTR